MVAPRRGTREGGAPASEAGGTPRLTLAATEDERFLTLAALRHARDLTATECRSLAQLLLNAGASPQRVARALGVSRAHVYRLFRVPGAPSSGRTGASGAGR